MDILVVDDEPDVRKSLSNFLKKLGHKVYGASDGMSGLKEFHSRKLDLVITDLRMPGMEGLELLRRIKQIERSPIDVIVVTGHGDINNAIKALKYGAYDYLQKPINVRELAITIERSEEYAALRKNYNKLKKEFNKRVEVETQAVRGEAEQLRNAYLEEIGLEGLHVFSEAMYEVVHQAEKYSLDRSVALLIEGESGTGKELVARYTHHYTQGGSIKPFIAINCGALSQELIEAELFGHEPGAYTGATPMGRIGKLEAANEGTVFFDEIGEMPLNLQVKLLRVLEEKRFHRVGGVKERQVDIRIICASNKDLQQAVSIKQFRLDLYHRISMGNIRIPPLRDRKDDILPLAHRFASRAFQRKGKRFESFTPSSERILVHFPWPGNARQLKNAIERLAIFKSDGIIDDKDLSFLIEIEAAADSNEIQPSNLGMEPFNLPEDRLDLDALNSNIIKMALDKNRGNQTQTAKYLGISRRVLQGRLKKMGLR